MDEDEIVVKYKANKEQSELEGCDRSSISLEVKRKAPETRYFYPNHWSYGSILLALICFTVFIGYYCNESPGGLEDTIIKVMGIDATQYNLLFLVTTWPNIFVPVIGGVIADRILGPRSSYIIVVLILTLGQIIWSVGSFINYFWVVLIGRFFIGAGAATITSVTKIFQFKWCGRKYLTFGLSVSSTMARLGAAVGLSLPQFIYNELHYISNPSYRLGTTVMVGVAGAFIAVIVTVIIVIMDKFSSKKFTKSNKVKCSDAKHFSLHFWIAALLTIYYSVVLGFAGIGQVFYAQKYRLSLRAASLANSLVFSAAILLTPVMGYVINAIGYHLLWTISGIAIAVIAHFILLLSNPGLTYMPYVASIIYSISYTLFSSSFWPLIGFLVEGNQVGTAYGIVLGVHNLFWGLLSIVSGVIIDKNGYFVLEIMYSLLSFLVLMVSVLVLMTDLISKRSVLLLPGTCIGQVFYAQKYGLSLRAASLANSLVFSATILLTPVMGYVVNAIGYHLLWTISGLAIAVIVHLILLLSNPGLTYIPYIASIIYSISYTILGSSYWPLVGFLVETNQIGTAYGIVLGVHNLFWGLLAIVSGVIIDKNGYFVLEMMYSLLSYLVLMVSVLLLMIDLISKSSVLLLPGTCTAKRKKKKSPQRKKIEQ
uniref:Lysosomal dipeptide transporter MFSD1 n=1 Tax=Amphimedon queenslandica TaxID=400682 RepID=A0A1X7UXG6_AMPQE